MRYAATIFLSAFLLFAVQPMLAKHILPWFGGTPAVWTTCMLFFQVLLLVGYLYVQLLGRLGDARREAFVHCGLLGAALLFLPILPDASHHLDEARGPVTGILILLAGSVGAPYLLLSATGPLLQSWYARAEERDRGAYRLYALSNVGSLLALVSYPLVFEPLLSLSTQFWIWSAAYAAFAVGLIACAVHFGKRAVETPAEPSAEVPAGGDHWFWWIALAAGPSTLLLATTNRMTQEVAPIPFLWVLPLAVYLISFILTFDDDRWYDRRVWAAAFAIGLAGISAVSLYPVSLPLQLALETELLFAGCMLGHGELVRVRPHASRLTRFYVGVATGGALGGLFVSIGAPLLFDRFAEYPIGLLAVGLCFLLRLWEDPASPLADGRPRLAWAGVLAMSVALMFPVSVPLVTTPFTVATRTFFGVRAVDEVERDGVLVRRLYHGATLHGQQFTDPARRSEPTSYFGPLSGIGRALRVHGQLANGDPRRIGVAGLGVGTLAAYARAGDELVFYEIDPEITRIAREEFDFLSDSAGTLSVIHGDARLKLLEEVRPGREPRFDVLVLDAFSSDAVPTHLLTREAFATYGALVAPEGLIAVNISNRNLDLTPVVRAGAAQLGRRAIFASNREAVGLETASDWVLISNDEKLIDSSPLQEISRPWPDRPALAWTDDWSNLITLLKW